MIPNEEPYRDVAADQLILRDHLAADRTVLANDRTFLAYVRTSLALVIAGLTLIRFFDDEVTAVLGVIFVPLGILTIIVGVRDYYRMKRRISLLNCAPAAAPPPCEEE